MIGNIISQSDPSKTFYEEDGDISRSLQNGIAIGRIEEINASKRLARVKTFFGPPHLCDLDIPDTILVFPDANLEGDEMLGMYRKNSLGLVFFISNQAYYFGGIKPWNATEGDPNETDQGMYLGTEIEGLVAGDKIIGNKKGNHIIVKANGTVNIVSELNRLQRTYYPVGRLMRDICSQYIRTWDGGSKTQMIDNRILKTYLETEEVQRDLFRSFLIQWKKGSVGGDIIYQMEMGAGIPAVPGVGLPILKKTISVLGEMTTELAPLGIPAYKHNVDPLGNVTMEVGPLGNVSVSVGVEGSVSVNVNKLIDIEVDPLGGCKVANKAGSIEMSPAGDLDLKNKGGEITMDAFGETAIKNKTAEITMSVTGDIEAKGPAHDISMSSGTVAVNGSEGKLSLSKGQVAVGGPAGELVEEVEKLLGELDKTLTALQSETHVGNLGYNTSPPVNLADYLAAQINVKAITAIIGLIKGSL